MSFLVAVRPASAPQRRSHSSVESERRASLVVSLGTATQSCPAWRRWRPQEGCSAGSSRSLRWRKRRRRSERQRQQPRRNFQKITTSDLRHFVFPLYFLKMFCECSTIASLHRKQKKKRFRPQRAYTHKDESVKLPWYHLGLLSPHRDSLTAAAFCNATTGRCNGRSVAGLTLLHFAPATPGPFSVPCFLPAFPPPGLSGRINAKTYSSLHSHFCDIAYIIPHSSGFVNPFNEVFQ